jgi:hypothetical protein
MLNAVSAQGSNSVLPCAISTHFTFSCHCMAENASLNKAKISELGKYWNSTLKHTFVLGILLCNDVRTEVIFYRLHNCPI